jgi:hypothetical protein
MTDILANPVDIFFGSMPTKSTAPAACLVIEGNAVTSNQQVRTDLLTETHPPTPSDLITGIDRVEGMLSDAILLLLAHGHDRRKRPREEVQRMPVLCQIAALTSTGPAHNPSIMALRHVGSRLRGAVPYFPRQL